MYPGGGVLQSGFALGIAGGGRVTTVVSGIRSGNLRGLNPKERGGGPGGAAAQGTGGDMFEILWEMHQNSRIMSAGLAAGSAKDAASDARSMANHLQRQVDSLLLVNMAMWSILEERLAVTEDQLSERVREIDLRDGKLDGRLVREGVECPRCKRVMSARHQRCMYCGEEALKKRVF